MTNGTVVIDIDGTLADLHSRFCDTFGYDHTDYVSLEKRYPERTNEILEWVKLPSSYADLDVLELGSEVHSFFSFYKWKIAIVTSRPKNLRKITVDWLNSNGFRYDGLFFTYNKLEIIHFLGAQVVVDDMPTVMDITNKVDAIGFLIDQPYNKDYVAQLKNKIYRVGSCSEFVSEVRFLNQIGEICYE